MVWPHLMACRNIDLVSDVIISVLRSSFIVSPRDFSVFSAILVGFVAFTGIRRTGDWARPRQRDKAGLEQTIVTVTVVSKRFRAIALKIYMIFTVLIGVAFRLFITSTKSRFFAVVNFMDHVFGWIMRFRHSFSPHKIMHSPT